MGTTDWVILAVTVLIALGWYLSYTAARLDRLHARVEGTLAALDAQLVRRAEATLLLANSAVLDPASALLLTIAATDSLSASDEHDRGRFALESDLSEVARTTLEPEVLDLLHGDPVAEESLRRLASAATRTQMARRFHNDAVTDVVRVRRQLAVRVFHLAGHTELPRTVDFDDELPAGLAD